MDNPHGSRWLRAAFIIGIVVVLNLFFNYSIFLVYPEPQYDTFCPQVQVPPTYTTQASCVAADGQWNTNAGPKSFSDGTPAPAGYCNPDYTCNTNYQHATDTYARNVFIALVVLGVAALGVSFLFGSAPVVAAGLSWGGVLSLIVASARYWSHAQTLLQVIILAVALAALIWFGARRFK